MFCHSRPASVDGSILVYVEAALECIWGTYVFFRYFRPFLFNVNDTVDTIRRDDDEEHALQCHSKKDWSRDDIGTPTGQTKKKKIVINQKSPRACAQQLTEVLSTKKKRKIQDILEGVGFNIQHICIVGSAKGHRFRKSNNIQGVPIKKRGGLGYNSYYKQIELFFKITSCLDLVLKSRQDLEIFKNLATPNPNVQADPGHLSIRIKHIVVGQLTAVVTAPKSRSSAGWFSLQFDIEIPGRNLLKLC
ncbi:hypothetical protein NQ317_018166 [Molorchus minor]|uniref:Uncharacterized protein n=1 Tax=Molorchus minor TaxID=1323400 RepID=A0ABQ9J9M9_9CUCU|nr:hypothetical protein NQ317_018166 [Molorchus minor]